MPELPEVETVKNGLSPILTGAMIDDVVLRRPDLRVPFPKDFAAQMRGQKISNLSRRAKYILIHLENQDTISLHLGMSGQIKIIHDYAAYRPALHDHMLFGFEGGRGIAFYDPRRFGSVYLIAKGAEKIHPAFATLGPEPLSPDFTAPVLARALKGRITPIKQALLNQKIVAGLGNIYVSEALFYAGVHPLTPSAAISRAGLERLIRAIRATLERAIAAGGSTLKDYRTADGALGYFQHQFTVYGRDGQPCPRCPQHGKKKTSIEKIVQGGRSTYFCPRCQK